MTHRILSLVICALLAVSGLGAQQFYPDDPISEMPDPLVVEDAEYRKLNDYYDLFTHQFKKLGEVQPKQPPFIRAKTANTIDEAPDDPAWYVNRIGTPSFTREDLLQGPGSAHPPADGPWTIVAAKTEGVTPGFRIKDREGRQYILKFDPLKYPEMATGADVVGSLLLHALGYNVPENYLVDFDPKDLEIDKDATLPDEKGHDRPITRFDVEHALLRVPVRKDGRIRAVASRLLDGKILGEFRFFGTRMDDPNDVVPHEHRRDLRGLFVFNAWINHNDSRAINDLDSLVTRGDLKYVKHFLIDFGAILGSASILSNTARDGHAYFWDPSAAFAQIASLGLYVPYWARADYDKSPALGMIIDSNDFRPDEWKPNYPNPAYDNRLPDDEFWAAKKVMAFTDEDIRAVVAAAKYSDPDDSKMLTDYLIGRRDVIGKTYLPRLVPLDQFKIADGKLAYVDLAAEYNLPAPASYQVRWANFDNASGESTPISGASGWSIPQSDGEYLEAVVTVPDDPRSVVVHVRDRKQVVGVKRYWLPR